MYTSTQKLKHHEASAKLNLETGEFSQTGETKHSKHKNQSPFEEPARFAKNYYRTWNFLETVLTKNEYYVVHLMSRKAKSSTNTLAPLNDKTTAVELAETFGISRNSVGKVFKKLRSLGVYAEILIEYDGIENNFWIFNPYISFNGRYINDSLVDIFKKTTIGKQFKGD